MLSVIVATFNSEKYLHETIASLDALRPELTEVIFVDGGSTDSTLRIIASAPFKHVLRRQVGKGMYSALNEGISIAAGPYVAFLHSDDIWLSGPRLPSSPEGNTVWVGDVAFFRTPGESLYLRRMPLFPKWALSDFPFIFHPNAIYPKSVLERHPYDETIKDGTADMVQIAALAPEVTFRRLKGFRYGFRIHDESTTVRISQCAKRSLAFWFWRVYVFLLFETSRIWRLSRFVTGRRIWIDTRA